MIVSYRPRDARALRATGGNTPAYHAGPRLLLQPAQPVPCCACVSNPALCSQGRGLSLTQPCDRMGGGAVARSHASL